MKTNQQQHTQGRLGISAGAAVLLVSLLIAGCGGGGGTPGAVNGVVPSVTPFTGNSYSVTTDNYGMTNPNYLAASTSTLGVVLRSALATSMSDPDFKTVSRIDIPAGVAAHGSYSLGSGGSGTPAFPGTVYFFNGHQSTLLRTVGGSISFSSFGANPGDRVTGSFSAVVEDGSDSATPKATYTIAASFDFVNETAGAVLPAPAAASAAAPSYDAKCAACHALGSYDSTTQGASDLALKGGKLTSQFGSDLPGHQGVTLSQGELSGLKVLLNAY
ncbi:hypothetical protein GMLC_07860 [Geomonas limicola]|uniref:Cytochrome c domain-containing protein n=1 Tax=Geomonas limicola TaxID=2740186 RepID=A0A6V8N5V5_9BACT|nr:hypothetical protein [Geomonas limicola]GFO67207.1 hypothetical protein GMLC_07860 [Geomonas limicola]